MPKSPETIDGINDAFTVEDIKQNFGMSLHKPTNHPFFNGAVDAGSHSFCVFSSKATIDLVCDPDNMPEDERHILMDATFKIVPTSVFKQLLILYVRIKFEVSH